MTTEQVSQYSVNFHSLSLYQSWSYVLWILEGRTNPQGMKFWLSKIDKLQFQNAILTNEWNYQKACTSSEKNETHFFQFTNFHIIFCPKEYVGFSNALVFLSLSSSEKPSGNWNVILSVRIQSPHNFSWYDRVLSRKKRENEQILNGLRGGIPIWCMPSRREWQRFGKSARLHIVITLCNCVRDGPGALMYLETTSDNLLITSMFNAK